MRNVSPGRGAKVNGTSYGRTGGKRSKGAHNAAYKALVDEEVTVDGHTALMLACRAGHLLVARELLRAGATVDATDDAGLTALDHAQDSRKTEVVAMLLEHASHALKKKQAGESGP
jgi:ankyrin repeat protein